MKLSISIILSILAIILVSGCTLIRPTCPETCDDGNPCTNDYCSNETNFQCKHDDVTPCCGDGICNESFGENYQECSEDCDLYNISYLHSWQPWGRVLTITGKKIDKQPDLPAGGKSLEVYPVNGIFLIDEQGYWMSVIPMPETGRVYETNKTYMVTGILRQTKTVYCICQRKIPGEEWEDMPGGLWISGACTNSNDGGLIEYRCDPDRIEYVFSKYFEATLPIIKID